MLFRRRGLPGRWERLKLRLWPRVSWRRSALYFLKRILRLSGTPYAIAMGAAIGAAASLTPFIGFHFIITFMIAWALRANMIAGALGTFVGNPLTFPLIWASTYELGHFILDGDDNEPSAGFPDLVLPQPLEQILPLLKPMLIGAIPLGLTLGAIVYLIVYNAVSAYQQERRERLTTLRERISPRNFMAESGQNT
jgi:uncharacterized protein (DUF2062 family)